MPSLLYKLNIDNTVITSEKYEFNDKLIVKIEIRNKYIYDINDNGWYAKVVSFPINLEKFKLLTIAQNKYAIYKYELQKSLAVYNAEQRKSSSNDFTDEKILVGISTHNINSEFTEVIDAERTLTQAGTKFFPTANILQNNIVFNTNLMYAIDNRINYINVFSYAYGCNNSYLVSTLASLIDLFGTHVRCDTMFTKIFLSLGVDVDINLNQIDNVHEIYLLLEKI